jgi:multidrug efflux pump subunit AcrB
LVDFAAESVYRDGDGSYAPLVRVGILTITVDSIIGFAVIAVAPMPIFVTFGTLTAVMIVFSLLVSLLVLPSVLLLVTPRRTGEEREQLLGGTGLDPDDYDPTHARPAPRSRHRLENVESRSEQLEQPDFLEP